MHFTHLAIPTLASLVAVQAHPGHDINEEIAHIARAHKFHKRDISSCYSKLKARGHHQRTTDRRHEILKNERAKRGLPTANPDASIIKLRDLPELSARDAGTVLNTNHLSTTPYSPTDSFADIFTGNNSCILVPEVTEGPFYITGDYIRADVRETAIQSGIDLILDIQVIDTSTCEPVSDVYVDFWYANSTGTYSGVTDASVPGNINATFARGIQTTGSEGATQFTAFYPGHYQGRTQHIHVATHSATEFFLLGISEIENNADNVTYNRAFPNGTYQGSTVSHTGQIFFDTSLSNQIEALTPYSTNPNPGSTTNANDGIFLQEAALGDPVVEYSLLGSTLSEGLFGWIAFGIDPTRAGSIQAAAALTSNGGVPVAGGGGGGGPVGPPPNGMFPGGTTGTSTGAATLTSSSGVGTTAV
ncbi:hypothetical protein BOTCAL_0445g00040 [Botryotinia calthae]|uniref:Intradiol ring-cleavage dioxygenases domain-containing protein n=1 Tax=Botryotinia calthae TaxID=38488 RepID=A0A4Y8CNY7_9HELO|nr:hypothetical protein BOTCAL_0445g00040 [Botryotinia calthae]